MFSMYTNTRTHTHDLAVFNVSLSVYRISQLGMWGDSFRRQMVNIEGQSGSLRAFNKKLKLYFTVSAFNFTEKHLKEYSVNLNLFKFFFFFKEVNRTRLCSGTGRDELL